MLVLDLGLETGRVTSDYKEALLQRFFVFFCFLLFLLRFIKFPLPGYMLQQRRHGRESIVVGREDCEVPRSANDDGFFGGYVDSVQRGVTLHPYEASVQSSW